MSENKLLPCPFCGGEAKMNQYHRYGLEIKCTHCPIKYKQKVLYKTLDWLEKTMIESWNKRQQPQEEAGVVYVPCDENDERVVGGFTSTDGQSLCYVRECQINSNIRDNSEELKRLKEVIADVKSKPTSKMYSEDEVLNFAHQMVKDAVRADDGFIQQFYPIEHIKFKLELRNKKFYDINRDDLKRIKEMADETCNLANMERRLLKEAAVFLSDNLSSFPKKDMKFTHANVSVWLAQFKELSKHF